MKELSFKVMREMSGDRDYKTGDKRELVALDAIHLVRSGALEPANEEARKIMAELMNETPEARSGVVQAVKEDAPRNKDNGNAPANKGGAKPGGRKGASGGKAAAAPAGSANAAAGAGPATGTGTGADGAAPATLTTETQGAAGDGGDTTNGGDGSTGATTGGATGAPPAPGKRR